MDVYYSRVANAICNKMKGFKEPVSKIVRPLLTVCLRTALAAICSVVVFIDAKSEVHPVAAVVVRWRSLMWVRGARPMKVASAAEAPLHIPFECC